MFPFGDPPIPPGVATSRLWDCGFCRKNAIGSCLGPVEDALIAEMPDVGTGDGAEKRSSGRPDDVMELEEDGPAADESVGRERPPFPDRGISSASSAKASKEIRSAAFLFGFALLH